jgi:hypothetical protein
VLSTVVIILIVLACVFVVVVIVIIIVIVCCGLGCAACFSAAARPQVPPPVYVQTGYPGPVQQYAPPPYGDTAQR